MPRPKTKVEWKPKRFPRLRLKRKLVQMGAEIIRATWNRITAERFPIRRDIYQQKAKDYGEKAKHYFPIIANNLILNGIGLSIYLKVLSEYGYYGQKKLMPDPAWLASPKAMDTFEWLLEKEMRSYPGKENWRNHTRPQLDEVSYDKRLSEIKAEVLASAKIVSKLIKIHGIEPGAAIVFEWDKLSPWFLALSKPFEELQGPDLVSPETRKKIFAAKRYFKTHCRARRRIFHAARRFSVLF